ncbi:hypothetical protein [Streptomyces sp. NPDC090036]|uniref:hypothetical protein n=1 Tax=Streptomyces sp. NPDC090036 TaxID=3365926 RepID=UPI00382B5321
MAFHRQHRFHLDRDGHSGTVMWSAGRRRAELLVDGKVVALTRTDRRATSELQGEIADGDGAARPITCRIGRADIPGGEPLCALETEGKLYLMPLVPLTGQARWPTEQAPPHPR